MLSTSSSRKTDIIEKPLRDEWRSDVRKPCCDKNGRISIMALQMLERDMLEVEIGSNQETKRHLESLSQTPHLPCSVELLSVRSLSATKWSDTSDLSRRKADGKC